MRRRGDKLNTRRRVADLGNPRRNLGARQVSALARLRALGEFDLQIGGMDEVIAGHAEARGRDLLDAAVPKRIVDAVV